jgi:methyl-accepting chemotaxis protein
LVRTKWSISARIALAFSIVIVGATVAISLVELVALSSTRNLKDAVQHYSPIAQTADEFEREILNARINFIYYVTIQKPGSLDLGNQRYANARQKIAQLRSQSESDGNSDGLQPLVVQLSSALDKYDIELNGILKAVQGGLRNGPEYDLKVKNWATAGATLVQTTAQIQDVASKYSTQSQTQAASSLRIVTILGFVIMVFGTLTGVVCAYFTTRSIRKDLSEAALQLEQGAEQVASAASQVSASSHSLAEGASKQASFLQDTTVSSQKVDSISQKNTDRAHQANIQTDSVSAGIDDTLQKLQAMLSSMTDIVTASEKISKVATVIDGIAFQTNILALNAAVEAARAGENGLGFAVVADEVRNLAQRSSQAARETQDLIEGSIGKSKEGNNRLQELSDSIGAISEKLKQVRVLVREVSDGSQEQKRVLGDVTAAVFEIDQVTQQSAATAEETAAAGSQLEAQSDSMKTLVANLSLLVGSNGNFSAVR